MFGFSYDEPAEKPDPEYTIVETELEKKLKNINLDDFFDINIRDELNLNTDNIIGNQEQIFQMLKDGITLQTPLMDNAEKDLTEIDFKIDFYRSVIFEDGQRDSKMRNNNFLLKKGSDQFSTISFASSQNYLTENEVEEKIKNNQMFYPTLKIEKKSIARSSAKKSMENFNYSGFSDHELTELPGHVEAAQLLNSLSTKMGFKKNFLKYWTVIIRTDANHFNFWEYC
ncbi:hypothetical protein BpHYR1_053909 [Brachionus plicatilis]|uniref:Uncharacterized protein n=1 Tax=Brachionus plicatilis TaxID=10195 RepID=A0A3M7QBN1_BRAPC|nr:hypothetical protein BpHYR1_053909 [Brachionus plicatilis]